jgi:PAS domain S-box-containing protein
VEGSKDVRSASRKIDDGRRREKGSNAPSKEVEKSAPLDSADWKLVLDAIPYGLSVHSKDGVILHANRKVAEIYGLTWQDLIGLSCESIFHSGVSECPHARALLTGESVNVASSLELGGKVFSVEISPIADERGEAKGYVRTMRDITERQRTQEQLIRTERFATLGQMISSIAHDVGTPLNIISGYSEYLLMRTKADGVGQKELSTILQQTRRIAEFIKQMLDLARPSQGRADAIGLRDFLSESIDLIGHHLRKSGIKASINCKIAPPVIYGDAPRLRQAFFNLLLNAIQVLSPGGSLEIALDKSPRDPDSIMIALAGTEETGEGHDFSRSFSGFLQPGTGSEVMGMGLSLTKEIFDGYGAKIGSAATEDQGVAIVLYLPKRLAGN